MIDFKVDGNKKRVEVKGTIPGIIAELYQGIGSIYLAMQESDKDSAEIFRKQFVEDIEVAFMNQEEFEKHAKKMFKEMLENLVKSDWS